MPLTKYNNSQPTSASTSSQQQGPNVTQTQGSQQATFTNTDKSSEDMVKNVLTYILMSQKGLAPVTRENICKLILKEHRKSYLTVMNRVTRILESEMKYQVVFLDEKAKDKIVLTSMPRKMNDACQQQHLNVTEEMDAIISIKIALLALIGNMSGESATGKELIAFLSSSGFCNIYGMHKDLGDVNKIVFEKLVRSGYLEVKSKPAVPLHLHGDENHGHREWDYVYSVGPVARVEYAGNPYLEALDTTMKQFSA